MVARILILLAICFSMAGAQLQEPFGNRKINIPVHPIWRSANNRYLQDSKGKPFFLNAESMWAILAQCQYDSADRYLLDRQHRGVNTFLCQLVLHGYTTGVSANLNGQYPFSGGPFQTFNAPYFAHTDSIINRATALGFLIFLDVCYIGWDKNEGLIDSLTAASVATMKTYGVNLGNRYKTNPNIVWVLGGDHAPAAFQEKLDSIVAGIKTTDTIYHRSRLFTMHGEDGSRARQYATWVNFNFWYQNQNPDFGSPTGTADDRIWKGADSAYSIGTAMPFMLGEAMYQNEHSVTDLSLRKQMYWSVLRGACGQLYGNNPLWGMGFNWNSGGTNWSDQLTATGSLSEQYMSALFRSRDWHKLIPDRDSSVMTAGSQTGATKAVNAYTSDSATVIAYTTSQRALTMNPVKLKIGDSLRVRWFNPSSGVVVDSGIVSRASRAYNPPTAADWVLVLDTRNASLSARFNDPGTAMRSDSTTPLPVAITVDVQNVGNTTADVRGVAPYKGSGEISVKGVCWNTTGTPTTGDSHTSEAGGTGAFVSSLTSLSGGTTYYVRSYATTAVGTGYGAELTFSTTSPITFVQSNTNSGDGSSGSITVTLTPTAGNILVLWDKHETNTHPPSSVSDGTSSFTQVYNLDGASHNGSMWWLDAANGGAHTYTVTYDGSADWRRVIIAEFSYTGGTPTLETQGRFSDASSSYQSGSISIVGDNPTLVLCGFGESNNGTTSSEQIDDSAADGVIRGGTGFNTTMWYKVFTTPLVASQQGTATISLSMDYVGVIGAITITP